MCFFLCVCVCVLRSRFCQVIRGAGHYVFADQPDDFNRTVLQILAGRDEKSGDEENQQERVAPLDDEQDSTEVNL